MCQLILKEGKPIMKRALLILLALGLAASANATTVVTYGWEDGGTVLAVYPDPALPSIIATNVASWDGAPVHGGNFSLKLEDNAPDGTPQAFLVYLWFLQDGDDVTVGFWRYDTTPDGSPSVRIWGHWNDTVPDDPDGYNGSAGGNDDYGTGEGWDYTENSWTVADGHTGLVVEARTYSEAGDIVWLDDLNVEVPDHVFVQIPGCSPVATEDQTWSQVKTLYR